MKRILCICSVSLLLLCGLAVSGFSAEASALYQRCIGCHGADGAKPPHVLKGQKADALLTKMKGYADGSYGGPQKALMGNMVKNISPDDLKTLADYISKL